MTEPNTVRVAVTDKHIFVRCPFALKDKANAITGASYSAKDQAYKMPRSPATAREILVAFKGCKVLDAGGFAPLVELVKMMKTATAAKMTAGEALPTIPLTNQDLPPWEHQLQAYHFAYNMSGVMFAIGMGGGKTRLVIDLERNRDHKSILILCPSAVVNVWPGEFEKHAPGMFDVAALDKKVGSVAKKVAAAKKAMELAKVRGRPCVIVCNYESAWREEFDKFAMKAGFECVVCDESHKIKSPSGKASLFAKKLGAKVPYRVCLTGTPMPHSPLDIFAQYRFLDPGIFGTSFSMFKQRYAVMGGYQNHEVKGYQNEDELNKKLYSIAYRISQEELDKKLPPFTHVERYCSLGADAARIYKELEKDMIAGVNDGTVTVANALTKLLRHQQLTGGFLVDDDKNVVRVDTAKRDLLDEVVEDIDRAEPIVVFCKFQGDLDAVREIAEKHGRKYGELSGRQNDLNEHSKMPEWCDIMAVQIQAGGAGVDLTRAAYQVLYSVGFSLGDYEQALKRTHRPGQTRPVRYIHLIAEGTVDEKVYRALSERKQVVGAILEEARK